MLSIIFIISAHANRFYRDVTLTYYLMLVIIAIRCNATQTFCRYRHVDLWLLGSFPHYIVDIAVKIGIYDLTKLLTVFSLRR